MVTLKMRSHENILTTIIELGFNNQKKGNVDPHHAVSFRARGKRRGFSPGAAACHSQSARVHTEIIYFKQFVLLNFFPPLHNRT